MRLDKLKGFFGMSEGAESMGSQEGDNAYYTAPRESTSEEGGTPGGSKMMLLEPRAYSESQRNAVVVNLKRVTPEQAKRIVDFLSGTLYAIGGDLQKLGGGIFLCTPNNVNVEGKISDGEKSSTRTAAKKEKDADEEEFNW